VQQASYASMRSDVFVGLGSTLVPAAFLAMGLVEPVSKLARSARIKYRAF
jgi:hypothetical protein